MSRRRKSLTSVDLAAGISTARELNQASSGSHSAAAAAAAAASHSRNSLSNAQVSRGGHFQFPPTSPSVIVSDDALQHMMSTEAGKRSAAQRLADLHQMQVHGSHGLGQAAAAHAAQ